MHDWSHIAFEPVMRFPVAPVVLDLTAQGLAAGTPDVPWTLGRYDEDRAIYTQALFAGARTLHVGVDLGGPVGTPVQAFFSGEVAYAGYNAADGDYGHTVVTRHSLQGRTVWALFGHLSASSLAQSPVGRRFEGGQVLGWLGAPKDNGGWPPHVHLQLAWEDPGTHDMPGAVDPATRAQALAAYPDPMAVLRGCWPR